MTSDSKLTDSSVVVPGGLANRLGSMPMPVPQVSGCVDRVMRLNAAELSAQFLNTLSKILRNIQKYPHMSQARTLNTQGKTYREQIGSVLGGGTLLEAIGFEKQLPDAPHKLCLPEKISSGPFLEAVLYAVEKAQLANQPAEKATVVSSPPRTPASSSTSKLSSLEAMGFPRADAERALKDANFDVNAAAAMLLSEAVEKPRPATPPKEKPVSPSLPVEHVELPMPQPEHCLSEDERLAMRLAQELQIEEQQRIAALRMAENASLELIKKLGVVGEDEKKGDDDLSESETLARALQAMEEEDRRLRDEEERAGWEAAQRINQEMADAKFAEDMKRELDRQEAQQREEEQRLKKLTEAKHDDEVAKLVEDQIRDGPGYWTEQLPFGKTYERIGLAPDSPLYKMVFARFKSCGYEPIKIEYVQNPTTWELYRQERNKMKTPEVWRFHGTPAKNVDGISEQGILVSKDVSGNRSTIWSAEAAATSVGYSMKGPAPDGSLYMFLCRVLSKTAGISTVQNSHHIYPEFLIHYKAAAPQYVPPPRVPLPRAVAPAVAYSSTGRKITKKERRRLRKAGVFV